MLGSHAFGLVNSWRCILIQMVQISAKRKEPGTPPVLEVRNLSVAYRTPSGLVQAVREASLHIQEGETVSLVGETGSGKSTIALAMLGLLENASQSGEILYKDRGIHTLTKREWKEIRNREIGIVFQDCRSALNPVLTVLDHLMETIRAHQDSSKREARKKGAPEQPSTGK